MKLTPILSQFGIEAPSEVKAIDGGLVNDTYRVRTDKASFIAQRINKEVFKEVTKMMDNIEAVHQKLQDVPGYVIPEVVPNTNGKPTHRDEDGAHWRVTRFIENSHSIDATDSTDVALEAGRIIGVFHRETRELDTSQLHVTLPHFHDLTVRLRYLDQVLDASDHQRKVEAKDCIKFIEDHKVSFERMKSFNLPSRVTHNDTKLNNILFDKQTMKALCLIDLDTIMPGYAMHDFGDAIRTLCNTVPEDLGPKGDLDFDMALFEHFAKGYLSEVRSFLAEDEWESMVLSVQFMPFIMGVRFLTDCLQNNPYYKVEHVNQNLHRAENQFKFIRRIKEKQGEIEEIIYSYR